MSKKNLPIFVAILAVAIIAGLLAYFGSHSEPRYQGRTLNQWLDQAFQAMEAPDANPEHPERSPKWLESQSALLHMGTNAIPFLLDDLLAPKSKFETGVSHLARNPVLKNVLGRALDERLRGLSSSATQNMIDKRIRATTGFSLLGTNANSAYPLLIQLASGKDEDTRLWGFLAFAATKPPEKIFIPVAIGLFNDPDEVISVTGAAEMSELYPDAAKTNGVYDKYPDLRPANTNQPVLIN